MGWIRGRGSSGRLEADRTGDEDAHDLAGALADLEDLGVAVEAGDGELLHVAVAAVDLDGVAGRGDGGLGGVQLGDGRLAAERLAGVEPGRGLLPGQAGGVGPDLHVGDLEGDRLEPGDRLAERLALAGVAGA